MDALRDLADVKALNILGWFGSGLALTMNLNNINSVLTVVISILSIVFLSAKIFFLIKRKGK